MYPIKLALVALVAGAFATTQLSAQRPNKPASRPTTIGNSILPNGSFENPLPSNLPSAPTRPTAYPESCMPSSPEDSFYEDEENREGGRYQDILDYAEDNNITYTEAQMAEFKTFVDQYVDYLSKIESYQKGRPAGWWLYPKQGGVTFNSFFRTYEGAQSGQAAMRISGYFGVDHQIYTEEAIPVNAKAKYLISYRYRGNHPMTEEGSPRNAHKLLVVRLTWYPKAGTALSLNGKELAAVGKSWQDVRDNSNTLAKDGFVNALLGIDLRNNPNNEWREKYMEVEAPANAATAQFELLFPKNEDGNVANYNIEIDNVTMTLIEGEEGEAPAPVLSKPTAPTKKAQRYTQREFTIEWTAATDQVDSYEVEVAEKQGRNVVAGTTKTYTTTATNYTFEGMEPGKTYQVRIRTTKGSTHSDYSDPLNVNTRALGGFTGETIPFLYTIDEDGSCPQTLPLYYMELTNPEAKRTYYIDGVEVRPEGRTLRFDSVGAHTLRITIEESTDMIWDLEYQLNVK